MNRRKRVKIRDGIQFDTIPSRVDLIKRRNFFFLRFFLLSPPLSSTERKRKFEGTKENDGIGNLSKKKKKKEVEEIYFLDLARLILLDTDKERSYFAYFGE